MADLGKIKRNVAKMVSMGAPETDIDGYIASEGVTVDDVRDYGKSDLGAKVALLDKGATFGFGRKAGGLINAIGSYPVDRIAEAMGVENTPSFSDRYHEITDEALKQADDYAQRHPVKAMGYELAGSVINPLNKIGVGYIKGANTLGQKAIRSGIVGSGIGGISGIGRSENLEDLPENVAFDMLTGGVLGGSIPYAEKGIGKVYRAGREFFDPAYALKDKATGLGNVAKDNDSMRMLKRGIQASDDVASQVLEQTPEQLNALNQEIGNNLEKSLKGRVNYDENIVAQKQKWADYAYPKLDEQLLNSAEEAKQVRNLPKLSDFTKELTDTAKKEFDGFIAQGVADSKNKAGSLGAIHRALQYANKRIDSVIHEDPLRPKPKSDPDVQRLMSVKDAINNILERGGIKPFDKNIAKAEGLKSMYEQGYKFNPSNVKFNYANVNTNEEKQAFLTGFIDKITDDVRDGKNLADAVRKNENVFKNLMPNNEYKGLLKEANRISTEYERINSLSKIAKNQLVKPEALDRPVEEMLDAGKFAGLGRAADRLKVALFKKGNEKKANMLLNGTGNTNKLLDAFEQAFGKKSVSNYTPYIAQALSQNQ